MVGRCCIVNVTAEPGRILPSSCTSLWTVLVESAICLEPQCIGAKGTSELERFAGCGIDPDTSDQIFEPFFTTKESGKGTGLGLYNVKTTVGKMHGTIAIQSEADRGTTFTLTFPTTDPLGGNRVS